MSKKIETISPLEEIRAYSDEEYPKIIKQLMLDFKSIRKFRKYFVPNIPFCPSFILNIIFRRKLYSLIKPLKTRNEFFEKFGFNVMTRVIENTSSGFTHSGLEKIEQGKGYFFISNHRDILLDSALLDYSLVSEKKETVYMAFGDNLVMNPFIGRFMRLCKGFIVKRNLPMREQFQSSLLLSQYINYLLENNNSVWIAQKDGRAKDGNDFTKPSVLKMFHFSKRKEVNFSTLFDRCNVIPVSISYEYDPNDAAKARELYSIEVNKEYTKKKYEDLDSIINGAKGFKGRIHLAAGDIIQSNGSDDAHLVSESIDAAIHKNYRLWPTNYIAYDLHHKESRFAAHYTEAEKQQFLERLNRVEEPVRPYFLMQYYNPVINRLSWEK